ncbi:MAG: MOSC domain-containing protein, partial [Planctomycetota bacterium]
MLVTGRVESIQIGRIQTFERQGKKAYTSAIIKTPVSSGVTVESEGIVGDQQADRKHHGGRDKAILSYTTESLAFWQSEFPELIWTSGAFGENLTLSGLSETDVCIGDIFEVGEVTLQITQPREPCWKLSER